MAEISNIFLTNQCISAPIIENIDSHEKGMEGFVKRQIISRVFALGISPLQALDCARNIFLLGAKIVAILDKKMGGDLSSKFSLIDETASIQLKDIIANIIKCVAGVLFGSFLSVISPACFVPLLFAPINNFFKDPIDSNAKYAVDDHFSKSYVINLEKATQKWERTSEHLKNVGIEGFDRFSAVNGYELDDEGLQQILGNQDKISYESVSKRMSGSNDRLQKARMGCYLSHLAVLKQALADNLPSVVIFEDDAVFPQTERAVRAFNGAMQDLKDRDWQILFLGYEEFDPLVRESLHLDYARSGTQAHAYAVNQNSYSLLIKQLEGLILDPGSKIIPVDEVYSMLFEKGTIRPFVIHPKVCYQQPGNQWVSNITGNVRSGTSFDFRDRLFRKLYGHFFAPVLETLNLPRYRLVTLFQKFDN